MAQTITIEIEPKTGEFTVDLKGFHGVGCDALTKAFTEGNEVVKTITKPEYKALTFQGRTIQQTAGIGR